MKRIDLFLEEAHFQKSRDNGVTEVKLETECVGFNITLDT